MNMWLQIHSCFRIVVQQAAGADDDKQHREHDGDASGQEERVHVPIAGTAVRTALVVNNSRFHFIQFFLFCKKIV